MIDSENQIENEEEISYQETDIQQKQKNTFLTDILKQVISSTLTILIILLLIKPLNLLTITVNCNCSCGNKQVQTEDETIGNYEFTDEQRETEAEETIDLEDKTITFSGYMSYTVSSKNPNIELMNSEENEELGVYMIYTVIDETSGDVIAKTSKQAPGGYAYVNVYDFYKTPGEYDAIIRIETSSKDGTPLDGLNQAVKIKVQ